MIGRRGEAQGGGSAVDRRFALMFLVMLTIAAGNNRAAIDPARARPVARRRGTGAVAAAFSVSALLWVLAAPFWANRSDRYGRRAMILLGVGGFRSVAGAVRGCSSPRGSTAGSAAPRRSGSSSPGG
ncbi:MAG: hypothetical protein PGN08_11170 [Sphingomonas taxi]